VALTRLLKGVADQLALWTERTDASVGGWVLAVLDGDWHTG